MADVNESVIQYHKSPAHVGALEYAVDFIVPEGTPVVAAAEGVIADIQLDSDRGGSAKEFEPLGNFIEIEHDHGEYSEYEHLRKDGVAVRVGQRVVRGQVIGYSGATGWLAHLGSHLHFMVGTYGTADEYKTLEIQWAN